MLRTLHAMEQTLRAIGERHDRILDGPSYHAASLDIAKEEAGELEVLWIWWILPIGMNARDAGAAGGATLDAQNAETAIHRLAVDPGGNLRRRHTGRGCREGKPVYAVVCGGIAGDTARSDRR